MSAFEVSYSAGAFEKTAASSERWAEFRVVPEYGRAVTFDVRWRLIQVGSSWYGSGHRQWRYVVGLKGSDGDGFSQHVSFELACERAFRRAMRYHKMCSRPVKAKIR